MVTSPKGCIYRAGSVTNRKGGPVGRPGDNRASISQMFVRTCHAQECAIKVNYNMSRLHLSRVYNCIHSRAADHSRPRALIIPNRLAIKRPVP